MKGPAREEVLRLLAHGLPKPEIARRLGISKQRVHQIAARPAIHPPAPFPAHGTRGRYRKGCRCVPCKRWQSVANLKTRLGPRLFALVKSDPAIMCGKPIFVGTRVPIQLVNLRLRQGASIDLILEAYPSLRREHVQAVVERFFSPKRLRQ